MELIAQIPDITIGRAANAPHYEYMTTFGKRTATSRRKRKARTTRQRARRPPSLDNTARTCARS